MVVVTRWNKSIFHSSTQDIIEYTVLDALSKP